VDRRRLQRPKINTRASLERALGSWRRLGQAWRSVLETAQAVGNWERMALAKSKLEECQSQIARLESLLHPPPA
jgi:hypothetical protein